MAGGQLEQAERVDGVVAVVLCRVAHQFLDRDVRGEMEHGGESALLEQAGKARTVGEVADDQFGIEHRPRMAGGQVVVRHHRIRGRAQQTHHVAADVPGAARDQDRPARGHPVASLREAPSRGVAQPLAVRLAPRRQEAELALLEHQAGQAAGPAGAGIDPDPVGANDRLGFHGMAVNHDPAEIVPAAQKRLPDPEQIVRDLLIQRARGVTPACTNR